MLPSPPSRSTLKCTKPHTYTKNTILCIPCWTFCRGTSSILPGPSSSCKLWWPAQLLSLWLCCCCCCSFALKWCSFCVCCCCCCCCCCSSATDLHSPCICCCCCCWCSSTFEHWFIPCCSWGRWSCCCFCVHVPPACKVAVSEAADASGLL